MIQKPRGTRDFTSEDMLKRRYVEEKIRSTFISYGYNEIQTPTFETLELFSEKSGEEIIEELYSFKDKGGRDLALRPELTAPVIRFYVERLQMEPKPIKLFYFGNCYRYDRPQKGRYREFTQAGCELIGTDTIEALSELIALAYNIIKNVGVKDFILNIGNLNILNYIFDRLNLTKEQQKYLIPLIDKSKYENVLEVLSEYGIASDDASTFIDLLETNDISKIRDFLEDTLQSNDEIDVFQKILDFLKGPLKIENINVKLGIVRGLDYYRGVVFEIEAPALGAEKQLCGGGVYDLVSLFGGRDTPTSGFAIGFDRTIVALESEKYNFPKNKIDVFVIPLEEELNNKALEIIRLLRENKISTDWNLLKRGISKSLKYASSINSRYVILLGQDEIDQDSVTIKDLKSGKQELIKINNIIDFFKV